MNFQHFAGAAYRALTARKDGPSLYEVCDPLLLNPGGGDPHLGKFYRTALGNPALRPLLRRTGLFELRDEPRLQGLRQALIAARDDASAGLGGDRRAGGRPARHHRAQPPEAPARGMVRARAGSRADRSRDPRLRRASPARVRQQRFHSDLCRLQPDRRPRSAWPRIADGADRAEFARLQELDAVVQPGPDLHRALAGARAHQPALARGRRADVAADADPPPLRLLRRVLHRGAAEFCGNRPRLAGRRPRPRAARWPTWSIFA